MLRGNPALIVRLCTTCHSRAILADHRNLISRVDLLGALRRGLGTLAAFAAATLLWKEGGDPGLVNEVTGPAEDGDEEEIEEDAGSHQSVMSSWERNVRWRD